MEKELEELRKMLDEIKSALSEMQGGELTGCMTIERKEEDTELTYTGHRGALAPMIASAVYQLYEDGQLYDFEVKTLITLLKDILAGKAFE